MKYTNNLGLKKPEETDFYNIGDFNYNADKIDEKLGNIDVDANDILNKIKTVDGEGSGLDADTLDGKDSTVFATADHKHEMSDINNLKLTAENTTVKDVDNNFESGTVEGALKELAVEGKDLDKRIDENKTEVDKEIIDLKLSVADGKSKIATSVSGKGVPTNGSDSFQQMADNIDSIKTKLPILDGDVGVTEDTQGNVYGVEKIEERQVYPVRRKFIREWSYSIYNNFFHHFSAGIAEDFFLLHSSKVEKRNSKYQQIWEYKLDPNSTSLYYSGITTDVENNVYVIMSSQDTKLLKLNSNGNLIFEKTINNINSTQISNLCIKNNYMYVSTDERLLKFSLEGDLICEYIHSKKISSFDIDTGNNIYILDGSKLTKIDENTVLVWEKATYLTFLKISDDFMYTYNSNDTGYICRYDIDSGDKIWELQVRTVIGVGLDSFGNIYVLLNYLYDNKTPNVFKYDKYGGLILGERLNEAGELFLDSYANVYLKQRGGNYADFMRYKDNYSIEKIAVLKEREVQ